MIANELIQQHLAHAVQQQAAAKAKLALAGGAALGAAGQAASGASGGEGDAGTLAAGAGDADAGHAQADADMDTDSDGVADEAADAVGGLGNLSRAYASSGGSGGISLGLSGSMNINKLRQIAAQDLIMSLAAKCHTVHASSSAYSLLRSQGTGTASGGGFPAGPSNGAAAAAAAAPALPGAGSTGPGAGVGFGADALQAPGAARSARPSSLDLSSSGSQGLRSQSLTRGPSGGGQGEGALPAPAPAGAPTGPQAQPGGPLAAACAAVATVPTYQGPVKDVAAAQQWDLRFMASRHMPGASSVVGLGPLAAGAAHGQGHERPHVNDASGHALSHYAFLLGVGSQSMKGRPGAGAVGPKGSKSVHGGNASGMRDINVEASPHGGMK